MKRKTRAPITTHKVKGHTRREPQEKEQERRGIVGLEEGVVKQLAGGKMKGHEGFLCEITSPDGTRWVLAKDGIVKEVAEGAITGLVNNPAGFRESWGGLVIRDRILSYTKGILPSDEEMKSVTNFINEYEHEVLLWWGRKRTDNTVVFFVPTQVCSAARVTVENAEKEVGAFAKIARILGDFHSHPFTKKGAPTMSSIDEGDMKASASLSAIVGCADQATWYGSLRGVVQKLFVQKYEDAKPQVREILATAPLDKVIQERRIESPYRGRQRIQGGNCAGWEELLDEGVVATSSGRQIEPEPLVVGDLHGLFAEARAGLQCTPGWFDQEVKNSRWLEWPGDAYGVKVEFPLWPRPRWLIVDRSALWSLRRFVKVKITKIVELSELPSVVEAIFELAEPEEESGRGEMMS